MRNVVTGSTDGFCVTEIKEGVGSCVLLDEVDTLTEKLEVKEPKSDAVCKIDCVIMATSDC